MTTIVAASSGALKPLQVAYNRAPRARCSGLSFSLRCRQETMSREIESAINNWCGQTAHLRGDVPRALAAPVRAGSALPERARWLA